MVQFDGGVIAEFGIFRTIGNDQRFTALDANSAKAHREWGASIRCKRFGQGHPAFIKLAILQDQRHNRYVDAKDLLIVYSA